MKLLETTLLYFFFFKFDRFLKNILSHFWLSETIEIISLSVLNVFLFPDLFKQYRLQRYTKQELWFLIFFDTYSGHTACRICWDYFFLHITEHINTQESHNMVVLFFKVIPSNIILDQYNLYMILTWYSHFWNK